MKLDNAFWSARWQNKETQWDIGYPSPAIADYINTISDKETRILIPGCGNAYEAEYLHKKGFRNVVVLDYAPEALKSFGERVPDFPKENLVCADFFNFKSAPFELILEQTFFCAIDPAKREAYVNRMSELLVKGGKLAGLLFTTVPNPEGPPFPGTEAEYRGLFSKRFTIEKMEPSTNSIEPRKGRELWFECINN